MSFTDKDNNVIKDKLMDSQLPPVEDAWAKMNEILGPPPIQAAASGILGKINKIYLNVFIGIFVVSSALLLHSQVRLNDSKSVQAETMSEAISASAFDYDTETELPTSSASESTNFVTAEPMIEKFKTSKGSSSTKKINQVEVVHNDELTKVVGQNWEAPIEMSSALVSEKKMIKERPFYDDLEEDLDEDLDEKWTYQPTFHNSFFGIRIGVQAFPDVQWSRVANVVSGGIYYQEGLTPNRAIQIEALYNPIAFRPITYVERSLINGNVVVDSALVSHNRQISIPLQFVFNNNNGFNFMLGGQYSYVMSVQGDLYKKTQGSAGIEEYKVNYSTIKNQDAFIKHDFAMVLELNYQAFKRLSFGLRAQQSFRDQSKSKLGSSEHRHNAVQIKTALVLIK